MRTYREIIKDLYCLHEARLEMSHHSIYQGTYEEIAIKLNKELVELTGLNYVDYPARKIKEIATS